MPVDSVKGAAARPGKVRTSLPAKVARERMHIHFEQEYATYVRDFPVIVGWALRNVSAITCFVGLRMACGKGGASNASTTSFGGIM